jgi:predicted DNA-binding transcriptional regulator YafY
MMRIHEALKSGVRTNASILAAKFEVSAKTVLRDIAFMRDRLDLPVEYDARICAFRYTESVDNFPTVQITEGELLSLLVAQKALEQYEGTPYHHQLQMAFQKLTASMRDKVSFTPATNRATVSFRNVGPGKADLKIFERISRAVAEGLEVDLEYKKPKSQATERRRVRPYHLANRDNFWYVVGHDLERNSLRNFAVARIEGVKVTAVQFTRPPDFSPEQYFGRSLGAFVGKGDYQVVIRFSAEVAHRIRERLWHESQTIAERSDGGVQLSMRLGDIEEVQRWTLGWGHHAKALAPRELVSWVREAAAKVVNSYQE